MGLRNSFNPRPLMQAPNGSRVEDFAAAVRKARPELNKVPDEQIVLIVGLVLSLIGQYLSFNRDRILERLVGQLKLRGYGSLQIWLIRWALLSVIDCLVDWFTSFEFPAQQFRACRPDNLTEIL